VVRWINIFFATLLLISISAEAVQLVGPTVAKSTADIKDKSRLTGLTENNPSNSGLQPIVREGVTYQLFVKERVYLWIKWYECQLIALNKDGVLWEKVVFRYFQHLFGSPISIESIRPTRFVVEISKVPVSPEHSDYAIKWFSVRDGRGIDYLVEPP